MKKKTTVQSVNKHSTPPAEETKIQEHIVPPYNFFQFYLVCLSYTISPSFSTFLFAFFFINLAFWTISQYHHIL